MSEHGDHDQRAGGGQGRWPGQEAWSPAPSRDPWAARNGSAVSQDAEPDRGEWRPRSRVQGAYSTPTAGRRGPVSYRRGAAPRPGPRAPSRQPVFVAPLLLVVLPVFGALASGSSLGIAFTLACIVAALGAALLCSPNGLWWIVPCTPTALLAVAFLWATFHGLSGAKTTVAAATNVFQDIAGAFPGIAAGTVAALIAAGVRVARGAAERRGKRG